MAMNRRGYSPLRAMAVKALLRVGVPVGAVVLALYSIMTVQTPAERARARAIQELKRKLDETMGPQRAAVDAMIKRLEKDPVAIKHMKAMEGMTPQQQQIYRRKVEDEWRKANGLPPL